MEIQIVFEFSGYLDIPEGAIVKTKNHGGSTSPSLELKTSVCACIQRKDVKLTTLKKNKPFKSKHATKGSLKEVAKGMFALP